MEPFHTPVMVDAVMDGLAAYPGKTFIDATVGFGGHTREFLRRGAYVLGLDADNEALRIAKKRLSAENWSQFTLVHGNFRNLAQIAKANQVTAADGVLFDLGVSSWQLDDPKKGFTYKKGDAPLDMRFDRKDGITAGEIINTVSRRQLYEIFITYGEEKHSRSIARAIDRARAIKPIRSAGELRSIIRSVTGSRGSPQVLSRIFQALRIAVNNEMQALKCGLSGAEEITKSRGRIAVISYHSLEDRIVKLWMRQGQVQQVTKKPITPAAAEIRTNRRARSAKLRIAQKK